MENKKITYKEYNYMFEKDSNGCFIRLIIPANENNGELNLIGKHPETFTLDEIIRMKKYAGKMFELMDKDTIDNLSQK